MDGSEQWIGKVTEGRVLGCISGSILSFAWRNGVKSRKNMWQSVYWHIVWLHTFRILEAVPMYQNNTEYGGTDVPPYSVLF